ncbi:MAG: patatin-like phospholipase family protein [Anaerolineales bacterium]
MRADPSIFRKEQQPIIGLALGGGVVRGFAHLGVISVLEQAGIPIDVVSGSSAGALIGALYCSGMPPSDAMQIASQLNWLKIAGLRWPSQGVFTFRKMERWLEDLTGVHTIESMQRPFAAVATDLDTGDKVVLDRGRLGPAVRASCSIPGFFDPVNINGRQLCDGSLVESIPVSVAQQMGADYVIGVDILTPAPRKTWGAIGYGLNALEIIFQRAGGGYEDADCLIEPDMAHATYFRFSKLKDLCTIGERAAHQ